MSKEQKEVIGGSLVVDGRQLSLSKAIRAGDFVFLTGQIPMQNGNLMTTGSIEEQTQACLEEIGETLRESGCTYADVVKSTVWLKRRQDFPGFNEIYGSYFPDGPPARSALISDFLVDILVEIECVAYRPL